jgi:hypothetical membrane protein
VHATKRGIVGGLAVAVCLAGIEQLAVSSLPWTWRLALLLGCEVIALLLAVLVLRKSEAPYQFTWTSIGDVPHQASALVGTFHDNNPWVGPMVFISSALYFYAQIATAWVFHPPYSLINNAISDLGNTVCGKYGSHYVCSPRHDLMNASFIFLGFVMAVGSTLLYHEFSERTPTERVTALIGFLCMAIGGIGAILVGAFPENTVSAMHITGAGLAIGVGNLGIFILGAALTLPESMRRYMLVFSTTSVTALVLFAFHKYFEIGAGSMERIAAYPETVWLIIFGLYIWRFRPKRQDASAT